MRNHYRTQYKRTRKQMKSELRVMMNGNMPLMLLVNNTVLLYKARHLETQIWHLLGTNHPDIYESEFCSSGIVGNSMCGRYDKFFHIMSFIDMTFVEKYRGIIPDKVALGDAYAIVMNNWKNASLMN